MEREGEKEKGTERERQRAREGVYVCRVLDKASTQPCRLRSSGPGRNIYRLITDSPRGALAYSNSSFLLIGRFLARQGGEEGRSRGTDR